MDNQQNNNGASQNGSEWLDQIFGSAEHTEELGPDLLAVTSARLTHPNDVELEKILAEDWASVPDLDEPTVSVPETESVLAETDSERPVNQDPTVTILPEPIIEVTPDDTAAQEVQPEELSAEQILAEYLQENTASEPAEQASEAPGDTIFFAPAEVPQTKETDKPETQPDADEKPQVTRVRKIRPAAKKGYGLLGIPHILSTFIWLAIILLIGLTLGHALWSGITDLMAFGKPDQQITITITDNEVLVLPDGTKAVNVEAVADKLHKAGLISNPQWFILFSSTLTDKANDIDPGTYTLNTKFDYNAMINNMQNYGGARDEVEILIPEGYTCAQIFQLLQENDVCDVEEMEAYLTEICEPGDDGVYALSDYWFLEDTPREGKYWLEGYLFPDTYRFYVNDNPENVIKKFLDGFDFRFTDIMRDKLETIEDRTGLDMTVHEVIIIASMIEKESAGDADSYMISSVIYNRLTDTSHTWHLNIDATIYYALGGNIDPETGLPKPLSQSDLDMDHPYNTYKYTGLPPGAIANPGRNSIDAALTPEQDGYLFYIYENGTVSEVEKTSAYNCFYYVYNPHNEVHIFSETEANHNKAKEYIKSLE